jgi:hypothetical protein
MSHDPFEARPELQRLRGEGYTVRVDDSGYVLVADVAYVTQAAQVARDGVLAYPYSEAGPTDHVVYFAGEEPSRRDGQPFAFRSDGRWEVAAGVVAAHQLSAKDPERPVDPDYYIKFKRYLALLGDQAEAIEAGASAPLHRPVRDEKSDSPFVYLDSASSRAGIVEYARRLEQARIALVGLGGSGSYILDLVSKTRVGEIHLFDGDDFLSHNAFRAPGAASWDELAARPKKVDYYAARYGVMKRGLVPHPYHLDAGNAHELGQMDFVFLSMEGGAAKRSLVEAMESMDLSFIDVSLDVMEMGDGLGGTVQATTSTSGQRDHFAKRVDFSDPEPDDIYSSNVQAADLNALSAVLAVIKWKKLQGFYADRRHEHWTAYGVDASLLVNGDEPDASH